MLPAVILLALLAAGYAAIAFRARAEAARLLPSLPSLSGYPSAEAAHLQAADALARRSPRDAAAVGALAMAYHADLFYEHATAAYVRAAALDPANWRWTYYRALVHLERGEAAEAIAALKIVVDEQPDLAVAWWRLGEAEFKQAHYDAADASYGRAEAIAGTEPQSVRPFAQTGRARIALSRGRVAEAIATLTTIVKDAPRFGLAHRVLADAYRVEGDDEQADRESGLASALRAYTTPADRLIDALADISKSRVFLLRQAAALDLAREASRREQLVRRALDADPNHPDVVYEMGSLLQQLRRPADALPYFTRHLDLVNDDQQTLVQVGKCYSDLGRLDEAESSLRKALALGDDAVGFYNLGVLLEQRDRIDEADASYRRAIALGPGLASARNNLGALLAARGRLDEATDLLLESIRLDPTVPDGYTNLSAVLLQRSRAAEAARYARLALEVEPRHADAHVNLAVALAQMGNLDEARRELEAALAINPRHVNARSNLEQLKRARD